MHVRLHLAVALLLAVTQRVVHVLVRWQLHPVSADLHSDAADDKLYSRTAAGCIPSVGRITSRPRTYGRALSCTAWKTTAHQIMTPPCYRSRVHRSE